MTINYTEEAKLPQPDGSPYNWLAILNGIMEALDAGAELTFVFGENVSAGEVVALKASDGKVYKAASNDPDLTPAIGFAPNSVSADAEGKVRWFGWIDIDTSFSAGDSPSWSPGQCVYVGSVAGRLAKSQYSWANAVGWAKSYTDGDYYTRIAINPDHRCSRLVRDIIIEKRAVFSAEYDNGNSGAAATIDWTNGNKQQIILTGDCVLSFAHPYGVTTLTLKIVQDATGGRNVTWPPNVKWSGGTPPILSTTGNNVDIVCFYTDGPYYYGTTATSFA